MDRGTYQATVHGIAKSRTQLSDFTSEVPCKVTKASLPENVELDCLVLGFC